MMTSQKTRLKIKWTYFYEISKTKKCVCQNDHTSTNFDRFPKMYFLYCPDVYTCYSFQSNFRYAMIRKSKKLLFLNKNALQIYLCTINFNGSANLYYRNSYLENVNGDVSFLLMYRKDRKNTAFSFHAYSNHNMINILYYIMLYHYIMMLLKFIKLIVHVFRNRK